LCIGETLEDWADRGVPDRRKSVPEGDCHSSVKSRFPTHQRRERAAATCSSAPTRVLRGILAIDIEGVVEKKLITGTDGPHCMDRDDEGAVDVVGFDRFYVGLARVVDVSRRVASLRAIDHGAVRQAEEVRELIVPQGVLFIWGVTLARVDRNLLASVKSVHGEHTVPMHAALADLNRFYVVCRAFLVGQVHG
jgi:hypothetical protein